MQRIRLMSALGLAGLILGLGAQTASADLLWDNGDTDGSNGYSQTSGVNVRRSILDDFVLTSDSILQDFHTLAIWSDGGSNEGTGYELDFRADNNGIPGDIIASAQNTVLTEQGTGRTQFGDPERAQWVTFDDLQLNAGTYWVEMHVVAPDGMNLFQLTRDTVTGSAAWVNYEGLGGLQPGSSQFGVDRDISFSLTGHQTVVPAPGAALLGIMGFSLIGLFKRSVA